jgi:hypothetical protein
MRVVDATADPRVAAFFTATILLPSLNGLLSLTGSTQSGLPIVASRLATIVAVVYILLVRADTRLPSGATRVFLVVQGLLALRAVEQAANGQLQLWIVEWQFVSLFVLGALAFLSVACDLKQPIPVRNLAVYRLLLMLFAALSLAGLLIAGASDVYERLANPLQGPIGAGLCGLAWSLIALSYILRPRTGPISAIGMVTWCASLAVSVLGILVLLASGSRGPLLWGAVCLILLIANQLRHRRISWNLKNVMIVGFILFALVGMGFAVGIEAPAFERLAQLQQLEEETATSRTQLVNRAWSMVADSPLIGRQVGVPTVSVNATHGVLYPHNSPLEVGLAAGLPVAILFAATLLLIVVRTAIYIVRCKSLDSVALVALPYALSSLVSGSIYTEVAGWAAIGALAWKARIN